MRAILLSTAALLFLAAATGTQAQTMLSVWDGVYSDVQAERGSGQYLQHCAVCHGKALEGNGEAPPLIGQFIPDWAGTTLNLLYDKVQATMPLNAPGTLRPAVAADIVAFLLKANHYPSGSKELDSTEDLETIRFDANKPLAEANFRKRESRGNNLVRKSRPP